MGVRAVAVTGPASPTTLADLLTGKDADEARTLQGLGGTPINELVRGLVETGVDVELITLTPEIQERVELTGAHLRIVVAPYRPRARHRALDFFRAERHGVRDALSFCNASVIHSHWTYEFAWGALDDLRRRPVVVTAHDAPLTVLRHHADAYRAVRAAMAALVRLRTRTLTAVSPYLANRWRREMAYRGPIYVVPNAMRLTTPGDPLRLPVDGLLITEITDSGRLKNVMRLLEAFKIVRSQRYDTTLALAGNGLSKADELYHRAHARGLTDHVYFLGLLNRKGIEALLAATDVFVHASLEESFGMSILEAMAAGKPVVGGMYSGGVPWVISHAGVLVDVRDASAIATSVIDLLDNIERRVALGSAARSRVLREYSVNTVVNKYRELYDRSLERGR